MSKIYEKYSKLKKDNPNIVYLFKSGAFYIAINEDANLLNTQLNLKITPLGTDMIKCGFPVLSIEKYKEMMEECEIIYKIVEFENDNISRNNYNKQENKNINYNKNNENIPTKNNNLTIYQKYMDLVYYSLDVIRKFPKSERFALQTDIKRTVYDGLKNLMYAIKNFDVHDKLKYMRNMDCSLSFLKVEVRLSFKYKFITEKNYETWSKKIDEVGNILGGWINSCLRK